MSEGTVKENNNEEFNAYHTLTTEEAAEFIGTSLTEGLTQDESLRRLKAVGENTHWVMTLKLITRQWSSIRYVMP
ncbi:CRE_HP_G0086900.mRNA.1.CDS.1 [Saccharomyces cerevisiae]|nr:CRE_HP_G0086900.mRNA.1.CDS.1 [Saccharomyces cerevisiae]CAI6931723.1 CRE_HP_G0086900.mRNA.1.CDS.1 [Saccharomyces cerevisiae]